MIEESKEPSPILLPRQDGIAVVGELHPKVLNDKLRSQSVRWTMLLNPQTPATKRHWQYIMDCGDPEEVTAADWERRQIVDRLYLRKQALVSLGATPGIPPSALLLQATMMFPEDFA